jgi:hypothetical protein
MRRGNPVLMSSRLVAAAMVAALSSLSSFLIIIFAVGQNDFDPQNWRFYLVMLAAGAISFVFTFMSPAYSAFLALVQGVFWAALEFALFTSVRSGIFNEIHDPVNYLAPVGIVIGALVGYLLNR